MLLTGIAYATLNCYPYVTEDDFYTLHYPLVCKFICFAYFIRCWPLKHIFYNFQWPKCTSLQPFILIYTPIILFYQNLQRFKAYQIICGKATSLSRDNKIMSRDRWNFYFELKVPWNGIDSQNFAQDPAGPIWTALYRYIYPEIYFTTTETHFCQMSRENKNGEI